MSYRDDTYENETEEEEETAQEKRLRLVKKYLKEIEEKGKKFSIISLLFIYIKEIYLYFKIVFKILEKNKLEFDEDIVSKRLREEYLEEKGRLKKTIAINYIDHNELVTLKCKEHKTSITCICLSNDGCILYSGSKDGSLVKCKFINFNL